MLRLKRRLTVYVKRDLRDVEPAAVVMMGLLVVVGLVVTILL